MSGYAYDASGKPMAENPGDRRLFGRFKELRDAMREPGGRAWKTALVQIERSTKGVSFDFKRLPHGSGAAVGWRLKHVASPAKARSGTPLATSPAPLSLLLVFCHPGVRRTALVERESG
jgi:hypothetical protein